MNRFNAGMYNTSELELHWEEKSPITLAPELHLTEYVFVSLWTNETTINSDLSDLRHGAFSKLHCQFNQLAQNIKSKFFLYLHFSWKLQFIEFHHASVQRNGLLYHGLLPAKLCKRTLTSIQYYTPQRFNISHAFFRCWFQYHGFHFGSKPMHRHHESCLEHRPC